VAWFAKLLRPLVIPNRSVIVTISQMGDWWVRIRAIAAVAMSEIPVIVRGPRIEPRPDTTRARTIPTAEKGMRMSPTSRALSLALCSIHWLVP